MSEQQTAEKGRARGLDETCPECRVTPSADCRNEDGSRRYGWLHILTSPATPSGEPR